MVHFPSMKACGVLILAAGLGKRMKSTQPKVLHEIGGKPLLFHVINQVREVAGQASIGVVVGANRSAIAEYISQESRFSELDIQLIDQPQPLGTGHAARCAMDSAWGQARVTAKSPILILPGDLPLISSQLIEAMLTPLGKSEALRLLTCELDDPTGYGRIVRRAKGGPIIRIVEEKDAQPKERVIREVNSSIYLFRPEFLKASLRRLSNENAQKEYYLTDLIGFATREKKKVSSLIWGNSDDLRGVNDSWELVKAAKILNERGLRRWAVQGVRFVDPDCTWIDVTVKLNEGVTIYPGAILCGNTRVGKGTVIGPRVVLESVEIGENAHIKVGTVAEHSRIDSHAQVGPYAHLRPESHVGSKAKIGNFVELKKTKIGENSSVAHLSYLGDAEVGKNVNIGCGFVTCNYDGRVIEGQRKHRTVIEDDVFLGSDCQTVAPVRLGRGSYVASGSTITEDVEPEALAIARSKQVNKPGYARKLRNSSQG